MREALRGDLSRVSLSSVLQIAEIECLCGQVRLGRGRIYLHNGTVTDCAYAGISGQAAAVEALVRARGEFRIEVGPSTEAKPLAPVMSLVLESCRILDEVDRIGNDHLQQVDPRWRPAHPGLMRLCRVLDGTVSTAAVIARQEEAVAVIIDPLIEALETGHLRSKGSSPGATEALWHHDPLDVAVEVPAVPAPVVRPPAQPRASFDDLLFEARRAVRARSYDEAERVLHQALELRPGDRIVAQNLNRVRALRAHP